MISQETRLKQRAAKLGKKLSPEHKTAIGQAQKGKRLTAEHIDKLSGANNYNWTGDAVGYQGVHRWINIVAGQPSHCVHCKTTEDRKYQWANVSGKYRRDINDFIRLCVPCHKRYDMTEVTRQRLSASALGNTSRRVTVIAISADGSEKSYVSIKEAALELNVVPSTINNCLQGRSKSAANYKWRYGDKK